MASDADTAGFFKRIFSQSSSEPLDTPAPRWTPPVRYKDTIEDFSEDLSLLLIGGYCVVMAIVFVVVFVIPRACSLVYKLSPWGRALERERQKKATELELEQRKKATELELEQRKKATELELERRKRDRELELKRREGEIDCELKEASKARRARVLALDAEIGVCKRLLEIFRGSVTSQEDRVLELEKEKESLSQEALREEREALDKKLDMRRVLNTGA
ncbi:hypothetical protein C8R42DRAFT_646294 [Lentinula raphanica]|nr:hypothetical protein C8R42DRAFT_646294 [Lentinula raphanica]